MKNQCETISHFHTKMSSKKGRIVALGCRKERKKNCFMYIHNRRIRLNFYVYKYKPGVLYRPKHTETHLHKNFLSSMGWGIFRDIPYIIYRTAHIFSHVIEGGVDFSIREFSSFSTVGRLLVARLVV